jgi:hypothetical protein
MRATWLESARLVLRRIAPVMIAAIHARKSLWSEASG